MKDRCPWKQLRKSQKLKPRTGSARLPRKLRRDNWSPMRNGKALPLYSRCAQMPVEEGRKLLRQAEERAGERSAKIAGTAEAEARRCVAAAGSTCQRRRSLLWEGL